MIEDCKIRAFLAVVDQGSFTAAARSLGITQPAVSSQIASLYKLFPEQADELLAKTEEFAKVRLNTYKRLANK